MLQTITSLALQKMTNGDDARNLCNLLNSQSRSPANIISPPILNNH